MAFTTYSGPLRVGTVKEGSGRNTGVVVLTQTFPFTKANTGAFSTGITLPAGSQIIAQYVDTSVVWNSGTSDALEIGTSTDPDAYGDVADLQATAGRLTVTMDADQAALCPNIGTADKTIYLKINSSGTAAATGTARYTVVYAQKTAAGVANPTSV